MSRFHAMLLPLLAAFSATAAATAAQEDAKWFVLRDHQIGSCWSALLVKVDGSYRHAFLQVAGGPYDTEAQALERKKALRRNWHL